MTPAAAPASAGAAPMHDAMVPADREGRWTIRGWGARVDPTDDKWRGEYLGIDDASQFSLTRGIGIGADAEYQMNRRWGVDFGLMAGVPVEMHWMFDTVALWEMDTADLDVMAAFVGLNYHFLPDSRIDIFAGPFVSLFEFGSTSFKTANGYDTKVDPDGEFALGAIVGFDIPFSADSSWIATGGVRYIPLSIEDSPIKFDVDPMIYSLGIGYRF
jgi:outer membrane protein W